MLHKWANSSVVLIDLWDNNLLWAQTSLGRLLQEWGFGIFTSTETEEKMRKWLVITTTCVMTETGRVQLSNSRSGTKSMLLFSQKIRTSDCDIHSWREQRYHRTWDSLIWRQGGHASASDPTAPRRIWVHSLNLGDWGARWSELYLQQPGTYEYVYITKPSIFLNCVA